MKKKFKGYLRNAHKEYLKDNLQKLAKEWYGPNLGYIYYCQFIGHPKFGTTDALANNTHTSLVVKEMELRNGDLKIETLNSIYKIKKEDRTDG